MLGLATAMISGDANTLMLGPLESMMLKVNMVRINPMLATKLSDDAFIQEERAKAKEKRSRKNPLFPKSRAFMKKFCCQSEAPSQPMETKILENTLIKLGTLLALGFGEAGANVISRCMKGTDFDAANVMVP